MTLLGRLIWGTTLFFVWIAAALVAAVVIAVALFGRPKRRPVPMTKDEARDWFAARRLQRFLNHKPLLGEDR